MYSVYLIIVLGLLSAFGPFVIDMYLPAMPEMTRVFSTSVSSVQLGLTFCMVGLAVGQIIFGPLSDRYGRKPVLYFSLLLYIAATLFCCLSQDIDTFNFARLLQGLDGAGAIVYSRSAPTDLYSGKELAKIIAISVPSTESHRLRLRLSAVRLLTSSDGVVFSTYFSASEW